MTTWQAGEHQYSCLTSYYHHDIRGSITAQSNRYGMITNVYRYDPYGQPILGDRAGESFYSFTGENYNSTTGLVYLQARYYNVINGRFISRDSYLGDITDPLSLNHYAYARNNPVNYTDPSGHKPGHIPIIIDDPGPTPTPGNPEPEPEPEPTPEPEPEPEEPPALPPSIPRSMCRIRNRSLRKTQESARGRRHSKRHW